MEALLQDRIAQERLAALRNDALASPARSPVVADTAPRMSQVWSVPDSDSEEDDLVDLTTSPVVKPVVTASAPPLNRPAQNNAAAAGFPNLYKPKPSYPPQSRPQVSGLFSSQSKAFPQSNNPYQQQRVPSNSSSNTYGVGGSGVPRPPLNGLPSHNNHQYRPPLVQPSHKQHLPNVELAGAPHSQYFNVGQHSGGIRPTSNPAFTSRLAVPPPNLLNQSSPLTSKPATNEEVFDLVSGVTSADFQRTAFNQDAADKEMRDFLEGAVHQSAEAGYDEEARVVQGFRNNVRLLPHQAQGVTWMIGRESGTKNCGILADDMGLGKTIQTLALICSNPPTETHKKAGFKGGTLIVCPLAVMKQWESEVKTKTEAGRLSVITHHGPNRPKLAIELERKQVVITTYQVIASEYASYLDSTGDSSDSDSDSQSNEPKEKEFGSSLLEHKLKQKKEKAKAAKKTVKKQGAFPLFEIKWHRVVLDEAQNIKNKSTKAAQACTALLAKFRWCLTGTPIQNNVDELYSLFAFLHCKPLNKWSEFRDKISKPVKEGRTKLAMKRLQIVLKAVMLRRLKTATLDGKPLLDLPARDVQVVTCDFDQDEREFYLALAEKTNLTFNKFMKSGSVMSNYTSVLTMLLRLRQACDHPSLVASSFSADPDAIVSKPEESNGNDSNEVDELADLFKGTALEEKICTICSVDISGREEKYCSASCRKVADAAAKMEREAALPSSAKTREVLSLLRTIKDRGEGEKTIIFSQFTTMLNVLEPFLKREKFKFVRYDGSMPNKKREESLEAIKMDKSVSVILISFKAGSTGLNLTCANNVILVDLWWNPALEDQAFDRAHRLGQKRDVNIYKLAISETVEDKILALQEKKRDLAAAALSGDKLKSGNALSLQDIMSLFSSNYRAPQGDSDSEDEAPVRKAGVRR